MPDTAQERRIRRMLAKRDERLMRLRPFNDQVLIPTYMIVDIRTSMVVCGEFSDLDALEAELQENSVKEKSFKVRYVENEPSKVERFKVRHADPKPAEVERGPSLEFLDFEWRQLKGRYGHLPEFWDMVRSDL